MEDNRTPIGILFDDVNYYSNEELHSFIDNMTQEQSMFIVIKAAQKGFIRNIYNLTECEVLSKSLRILNQSSDNRDITD